MSFLEVNQVTKKFGDFVAVDDLSFKVEQGEFITLLGPSGCGKTTLLKMIGGFYALDGGTIIIDGNCVDELPPEKRDTAMCFQSYALFPHLSVERNVSFGLEQKKLQKREIEEKVREGLAQVSMTSQAKKQSNELSGGQQQRVSLARAMVMRPGVMLFDEPLSNLDAKLRERVRFEIKKLKKELHFTAIYVTHDQTEALALSDRILVMREGAIEQEGSPRTIYNAPSNRFVADFIGAANILKGELLSEQGTEKEKKYTVQTNMGKLVISSTVPPVSKHMYIGWRPENIAFEITKKTENVIKAEVKQTAFQGDSVHIIAVQVHSDSKEPFNIVTPQSCDFKEGEEISFSIESEKMFFLESVQGEDNGG